MILFLRSLPALLAAWLLACLVLALHSPSTFWVMAACATLVPIFGLHLLTRHATLPRRFVALALFPALATLGAFGVLLFSESAFFQNLVIGSLVILQWLIWEQAFSFTHVPARYQKNALTNLAQLAAIAAFFFFTLILFDLGLYAGALLSLQLGLFVTYLVVWFSGLAYLLQADRRTTIVYGVLTAVAGLEFYILLNRLPPLPAVKAGVMVIIVGSILQLLRRHVEPQDRQSWWPFGVLALVLLSLLATARWFA